MSRQKDMNPKAQLKRQFQSSNKESFNNKVPTENHLYRLKLLYDKVSTKNDSSEENNYITKCQMKITLTRKTTMSMGKRQDKVSK